MLSYYLAVLLFFPCCELEKRDLRLIENRLLPSGKWRSRAPRPRHLLKMYLNLSLTCSGGVRSPRPHRAAASHSSTKTWLDATSRYPLSDVASWKPWYGEVHWFSPNRPCTELSTTIECVNGPYPFTKTTVLPCLEDSYLHLENLKLSERNLLCTVPVWCWF